MSRTPGADLMRLLAVDWGTSSLRGALLDADGHALQERSFPRGILTVPSGGFPAALQECFGDWLAPDVLCLISGMAGSKQGWREAPYCACPAGLTDIAGRLEWVEPGRIAIVPGLSIERHGVPDVMRGEETQIFGALRLFGLDDATLVLPGTHSKWVSVSHRRVTAFTTWMTGEFYALLSRHSILARSLPEEQSALDGGAFDRGLSMAQHGPGLLHTAFSARTLSLFGRIEASALPSYLSGLVIGEELKAQPLQRGDTVLVAGAEALTLRYERALAQQGVTVRCMGANAAWCGLRAIADSVST
jgi:2-dehydro-3-deoxygalactonokinase